MIANASAHRRANAFARALEERTGEERPAGQTDAPAKDAEHDRLLALADGLGRLPAPVLDPEVKTVQRARLIAAMEAMSAPDGGGQVPRQRTGGGAHRANPLRGLRPRSRWSKGLAAGGLAVGLAAGTFGGMAAASSDALPGDTLYGLKRGLEGVELDLAGDDADRGRVYLDQAATRMQEARRLMERGRGGGLDEESVGEVRRALSAVRHDAAEGHRLLHGVYERDGSLAPIQSLESFSRSQRDAWDDLRDRLPARLDDVSDQVSSVLDAIDDEVGPLASLLPPPTDGGPGRESGGPGGAGRSGTDPVPRPEPTSEDRPSEEREDGATPQPSRSQGDEGVIGDPGDILDPPSSGSPSPPPGGEDEAPAPEPEITLPPLLPDLLSGLGLGGEDE